MFLGSASAVYAVEFAVFGALTSVILPSRIGAIDPSGKVDSLALVLAVSAAVALIAQPLFGALSDRTRSRFGRRVPWVIGCSVVAAAFLIVFAGFDSVLWICIVWSVVQFSLNGVDVAVTASVVDRYPRAGRGRAFGIVGAATIAGGALGALAAGLVPERYALLSLGGGVLVLGVAAWYAAVNRDASTLAAERPPFRLAEFLRGFWVDPRRSPAFAWMFASRFVFILGSQAVFGYILYVLTDHIGLGERSAAGLVGLCVAIGGALMLVAILAAGWLSDRVGRRSPFLLAACAADAAGTVILLVAPSVPAVFVYTVLHAIGTGIYIVIGLALVSEAIPDPGASAAKDLGLYNVATNVAQLIAPIAAAMLIGALGGYGVLLGVAAALIVIAGLLILPLRRTH